MAELSLKGSHGYAIEIAERNRRSLEVFVNKGPSVVVYLIRRAPVRGDGIDTKLPGLGRVSVRFHPAGPAHTEPGFFSAAACHGGETVKQPGSFVGRIRLRGERGYTTVQATKARGQVVTTSKEVCKRSIFNNSKPESEEDATRVFADATSRGRAVKFFGTTLSTLNPSAPASTFFSGSVTERRRGMVIFRETAVHGTGNDLSPSDAGEFPSMATVTPPTPFHGSAAFQRMPEGDNTWTGSMSVDLPGAGRVALAGSGFSARLCRGAGCRRWEQN